jgi:hypothetical protein
MRGSNSLLNGTLRNETGRKRYRLRPVETCAGGEESGCRKIVRSFGQATLAIFSAARLTRPESGAKLSLASLVTASVFFVV